MPHVIEHGEIRIRAETEVDKHASAMLGSVNRIRCLGLSGGELLVHAAKLAALSKLVVHNEHKIPGGKFDVKKFEYDPVALRTDEAITETIGRLAQETRQSGDELMGRYHDYFRMYSAEEVKQRVLEKLGASP